jgi:hypothetical protein
MHPNYWRLHDIRRDEAAANKDAKESICDTVSASLSHIRDQTLVDKKVGITWTMTGTIGMSSGGGQRWHERGWQRMRVIVVVMAAWAWQ